MKSITEFRLVAYIFPETDTWGNQLNESDFPILANESEKENPRYGVCMRKVGPTRDNDLGLMVYAENPYLPEKSSVEAFREFKKQLDHALYLPVMHRGDFTHIFEQ